ncbi:Uncharacterised protein [Vibrio cholerae]|nr:Uncharacterised protein [Vibrio cholerae]
MPLLRLYLVSFLHCISYMLLASLRLKRSAALKNRLAYSLSSVSMTCYECWKAHTKPPSC